MSRGKPLVRQWNLLKAMQAHHYGLCADDLAARLECSKRQVQRDLKVLQKVGFPISYEDRDYGKRFWKMSSHFVESDKLIFSVTEMLSIYLGQKLLAPLAGTEFGEGLNSLLEKIKATLPPRTLRHFADLEETLLVKTHVFNDYSAHDKKIRLLNKAVHEYTVVDLCYKSQSKKQPYNTRYHPYGMVYFGGDLYCIGFMEVYQEIRTLKIKRVLSAELTGDSFQRPRDFSLKAQTQDVFGIFSASGRMQKIKIRLQDWAANSVRESRYHSSQRILKDDGDRVTVRFELADTTELKRWLLGFGVCAQVLAPESLVDEMAAEIKEMAEMYAGQRKKRT